jgi:hypothetical protein
MNQVDARCSARQRRDPERPHIYSIRPRVFHQRRLRRRQQPHLVSRGGQPSHQIERLPLPSAHLDTGINVKDEHSYLRGFMFLALAYFRNV